MGIRVLWQGLLPVRPTHTLRVQQRQTATLRTIATTRPPRPRYPPPCLCLHALLYLFALSRLCLCVRIVVYLYCLSVSCGSPPLYITPRISCLMIINPSLSVLFSNSIRLTALPERLTRTSHPRRSRLRSVLSPNCPEPPSFRAHTSLPLILPVYIFPLGRHLYNSHQSHSARLATEFVWYYLVASLFLL